MKKHYVQRRNSLLEQMQPDSVAVMVSESYKVRSNDTEFPFRQESNFYYLCGFQEDNAALVLVKKGDTTQTHLFVQPKNEEMELWTGVRLGADAAKEMFEIDEAHSIETFDEVMKELLKESNHLYIDLFSDNERYGDLRGLCKSLLHDRKVNRSPRSFFDVTEPLQQMRLIKSDEEVALIRKALAITQEAHHSAMRLAEPDICEYELQANIEYVFKLSGAYSDAYTTIVAGGNNANTLHYITNSDTLKKGTLLLIDAGCEYQMYASDITRTFPVDGKFTPAQKELYEMVLEVQLEIIDLIKPGVTKKFLQTESEHRLASGMVRLGILKGDVEELVEAKTHKKYFPHGIGHWMGLDVHDPCPYVDEHGRELRLLPGMVMTIEPGIYIREDDSEVPEQYRGIGIRIEDNILVTKEGCENLSAGIAKSVEEIETVCR